MRQCIFPACKLRPDDRTGNIALVHRFPKEEHIRKLWIHWIRERCGLPDFEFNYKAGLCYRHFDRHCYHQSNGLLKPFSYPTYTPQDLDNISLFGSSAREISINGVPKTNLIIKVDPSLLKKESTTEESNPGKKFVLLVTDQGMQTSEAPNSSLSFMSHKQPAGLIRPQDVPPLRFIGREKSGRGTELTPLLKEKSSPTRPNTICLLKSDLSGVVTSTPIPSLSFAAVQNNDSRVSLPSQWQEKQQSRSECRPHRTPLAGTSNSRSVNLVQTVLKSSRKRLREYRKRLQLEKKRTSRLEQLLQEMKEENLISVDAAEKIESVLYDE